MLEENSIEFKKKFLLIFTKELIRNTGGGEIFRLKKILQEKENFQISKKEKEKIIKQELSSPIKYEPTMAEILKKIQTRKFNEKLINRSIRKIRKPVLIIPETHLPQRFQYLKPVASEIQIDLEKLNPLINDFRVKIIQCIGADKNIVVKGQMGEKPTSIILTKEEINKIIQKFSETAKIPLNEGVFKVAIGNLVLSAIISNSSCLRFTIKKINSQPEIPVPKPF